MTRSKKVSAIQDRIRAARDSGSATSGVGESVEFARETELARALQMQLGIICRALRAPHSCVFGVTAADAFERTLSEEAEHRNLPASESDSEGRKPWKS